MSVMAQSEVEAARHAVAVAVSENPALSAKAAHDTWRFVLCSFGWTHGAFDLGNRTHPNLVAFDNLPEGQASHALILIQPGEGVGRKGNHAGGDDSRRSSSVRNRQAAR